MSRGIRGRVTRFGSIFPAALVGIIALFAACSAQATSYTVDTTNDSSGAGNCSLRDAVSAANGSPTAGSSCMTPGTGSDTITFSVMGTITLGSTVPTITDANLTIDGPTTSPGITIDGKGRYRVLLVGTRAAFPTLNLNYLTIAHGYAAPGGHNGGGMFIQNATVVNVTNCTFWDNGAAGFGGAIYGFDNPLNVTNSTFAANVAFNGGAISTTGIITVTNSTLSDNRADFGGGIDGDANLKGAILASNTGGNCQFFQTGDDKGYNISDDDSCGFTATGSAQNGDGVDPKLDALGSYGGPTLTFALKTGSPAIDAIPPADCTYLAGPNPCTTSGSITNQLTCDQRGFIRPALGQENCDIGAVEGVAAPTLGAPAGNCADDCSAEFLKCVTPLDQCLSKCRGNERCEDFCRITFNEVAQSCREAENSCIRACSE